MIPFVIEQLNNYANIITTYDKCEENIINDKIIKHIIDNMYEFCSEEYGHNIKINSYDDYCNKYCNINDISTKNVYDIFNVYYFQNNNWILWNINDHKDEIYNSYTKICK